MRREDLGDLRERLVDRVRDRDRRGQLRERVVARLREAGQVAQHAVLAAPVGAVGRGRVLHEHRRVRAAVAGDRRRDLDEAVGRREIGGEHVEAEALRERVGAGVGEHLIADDLEQDHRAVVDGRRVGERIGAVDHALHEADQRAPPVERGLRTVDRLDQRHRERADLRARGQQPVEDAATGYVEDVEIDVGLARREQRADDRPERLAHVRDVAGVELRAAERGEIERGIVEQPGQLAEIERRLADRVAHGGDIEEALEEVERGREPGPVAEAVAQRRITGEVGQLRREVVGDVARVVARAVAEHVDADEREALRGQRLGERQQLIAAGCRGRGRRSRRGNRRAARVRPAG